MRVCEAGEFRHSSQTSQMAFYNAFTSVYVAVGWLSSFALNVDTSPITDGEGGKERKNVKH